MPDPAYPFLGVHFTRRIGGAVDVGPNAVLALAREGYRRRDVRPGDVAGDAGAGPAFGDGPASTGGPGLRELRGSVSKPAFIAEARRLVPEVTAADVVPAPGRGARPGRRRRRQPGGRLSHRSGRRAAQVMTVRNAPSPGATSSLAIAEYLVDEVDKARV